MSAELAEIRQRSLDDVIAVVAVAVAADGGTIELVSADVLTGVVHVRLAGACGSCAVAGLTMDAGVERVLRQRLDWITEVHGSVEESSFVGTGGWRAHL
jgi:Fe-S cluster biogenesis protein NfuA